LKDAGSNPARRTMPIDSTIIADEVIELIEKEGSSMASYMLKGDIPEWEKDNLRNKIKDRIEEMVEDENR